MSSPGSPASPHSERSRDLGSGHTIIPGLSSPRMQALIVFLVGFVLAAAIILTNPIIFGGDTLNRLLHRDRLLMGHQLPLLQVLVAALTRISPNPALIRYMDAFIGALAGVGFYWVARDFFGETVAFPAALMFVTNPFFLALSTVPYQESLMLAGLLFAFHFFYRERWIASSFALALACITRYEAWAAGPVLALAYLLRKNRSLRGGITAGLLFGWMPALWILINRGLAPRGAFVVESSLSMARLLRYVHLGWVTVRNTQLTVVLLAACGARLLVRERSRIDWRWWIQITFLVLFLISVFFSAHGVSPDPERYVVDREAYIPICFVLLLAALGLARWPRWTTAIVALSMVLGVGGAFWYVRSATSQPETQLAYRLARYLDGAVRDHEAVLILAKPIPEETYRDYLERERQRGGEDAVRQARAEIEELGMGGTSYQKVLAYSRLGRDRLLSPPIGCAPWVAIWSDYPDAARELSLAPPVEVLRSGPMSVTIQQRNCEGK